MIVTGYRPPRVTGVRMRIDRLDWEEYTGLGHAAANDLCECESNVLDTHALRALKSGAPGRDEGTDGDWRLFLRLTHGKEVTEDKKSPQTDRH
jgi:hypothetical protein